MLTNGLDTILLLYTSILLAFAWQSPIGAFSTSFRPAQALPQHVIGGIFRAHPLDKEECIISGNKTVSIQQISLDDDDELERMSTFCINAFYNGEDVESSFLSRIWKDIKLAAMQKAQLLDISLSTVSTDNSNRCIFVAKAIANDGGKNPDDFKHISFIVYLAHSLQTLSVEIIGCCEVIEERLDVSPRPNFDFTVSERERRKNARPRPVIENLCVKREYRQSGVGIALVQACEKAVQLWPGYDEIFAQVEDGNAKASHLFRKCGYQSLFADPTCTEVVLNSALFGKEVMVTKWMMRKIL